MASDSSVWMKFLQESDLTTDHDVLMQYSTALASRFTTIEELLTVDEDELMHLGINHRADRLCLIKQAQLFDDRENLPLTRRATASNGLNEHWLGNNQSTPVNPQSKCSLSPALLSRISFNDRDEPTLLNENRSRQPVKESTNRIATIDNNEKIQTLLDSRPKIASPPSAHGMRTLKSLSDTVALQKKVLLGSDRLKRLTLPRSLLKRQTALISKKMSSLTNKLINPLAKIISRADPRSSPMMIEKKEKATERTEESNECRKMQAPSRTSALRRSTDLLACADGVESSHTVSVIQPLPGKRFKLGAPTTFVTRSLATHVSNE